MEDMVNARHILSMVGVWGEHRLLVLVALHVLVMTGLSTLVNAAEVAASDKRPCLVGSVEVSVEHDAHVTDVAVKVAVDFFDGAVLVFDSNGGACRHGGSFVGVVVV